MTQYINNKYAEMDIRGINIKEELRNCTFSKCCFRGVDGSYLVGVIER